MVHRDRLGRLSRPTPLAAYGATIPAVLTTDDAAADDTTGASVRIEQARYERAILDFESEVRRRRDAMRAEHLMNMRHALDGQAAE